MRNNNGRIESGAPEEHKRLAPGPNTMDGDAVSPAARELRQNEIAFAQYQYQHLRDISPNRVGAPRKTGTMTLAKLWETIRVISDLL